MELHRLLGIKRGVTAVIGAGGKTTLLYTLGRELAEGHTVLLCTTTKIFPFPDLPCARTAAELDALRRSHRLLCAGTEIPGTGKLTAPETPMAALAERFDYVLVEADGAARRPLKAHAPHEPVVPAQAGRVVLVAGGSGLGRPVREAVHRPEIFCHLTGCAPEEPVTAAALGEAIRREGLGDCLLLNQAEEEAVQRSARQLADLLEMPVFAGALERGAWWRC